MVYWHIGERINREVVGNQRAEYGKRIVVTVLRQLQEVYGRKGFEPRSIQRMMQFASKFTNQQIVSTLSTKLSWSHIIEIRPLKYSLQCEFYLTASNASWSLKRSFQPYSSANKSQYISLVFKCKSFIFGSIESWECMYLYSSASVWKRNLKWHFSW